MKYYKFLIKISKVVVITMKITGLLILGLVVGSLGAPADDTSNNKLSPRAGFSISTPDFKALGDSAKNMVKMPAEIAKDSTTLITDSVKEGANIGGMLVGHGTDIAKTSVDAFTDIGKAGVKMGTSTATNALNIAEKVGGMIPGYIVGPLISGGAKLGKQGVDQVNSIGGSLLDNIKNWVGGGLGWVKDTTKQGTDMIGSTADNIGKTINSGHDFVADTIGGAISSGLGYIPKVTIGASVNVGEK